jgi:hypothetical protein
MRLRQLGATIGAVLGSALLVPPVSSHEHAMQFSAGEPGNPQKPSRRVLVRMVDDGTEKDMKFDPCIDTRPTRRAD